MKTMGSVFNGWTWMYHFKIKLMDREEEISILLKHLVKDVAETLANYKSLSYDTIVKNGKLIEKYELELEEIKNHGK